MTISLFKQNRLLFNKLGASAEHSVSHHEVPLAIVAGAVDAYVDKPNTLVQSPEDSDEGGEHAGTVVDFARATATRVKKAQTEEGLPELSDAKFKAEFDRFFDSNEGIGRYENRIASFAFAQKIRGLIDAYEKDLIPLFFKANFLDFANGQAEFLYGEDSISSFEMDNSDKKICAFVCKVMNFDPKEAMRAHFA